MTAQAGSASSLSPPLQSTPERQELRRQLRHQLRQLARQRRRALSRAERDAAHRQFARLLSRSHLLRAGRRVAVYFAYGHEADLRHVIGLARRHGCELYLPVITHFRHNRMRFVRYRGDSVMRVNRYGIAEPQARHGETIAALRLDLVLLPLVAFDDHGSRLGSGAGFYDRSLQHLRAGRRWRRPALLGVGYECQRMPRWQPDRWDVPLDGMLTERVLHWF